MAKRVVLVAFNGEAMCFAHVLLNAIDMCEKGYDVKVVIEGTATKLVNEFNGANNPFGQLYMQVKAKGLIDCICRACSAKMEALEGAEQQGLPVCQEMAGHPSLAKYLEQGYTVITF